MLRFLVFSVALAFLLFVQVAHAEPSKQHLLDMAQALSAVREKLAAGRVDKTGMESVLGEVKQAYGARSLEYATGLSRLAMLNAADELGRAEEARNFYKEALRIREARLGRDSIGVARSLENLARVEIALGTDPNPGEIGHLGSVIA